MESRKLISGSSSSSFTDTLFGPKDNRTSSSQFGSYFGPASTGLGKDTSHISYTGSSKTKDFVNPKHSTTDIKTQKSNGQKARSPIYQTESPEPSYLSSSIYYGGQEAYPPTSHNSGFQRNVEASKILMEPMLQGEIGGKDLSTIEHGLELYEDIGFDKVLKISSFRS